MTTDGPVLVVPGRDCIMVAQPGIDVLREMLRDSIYGSITCESCGVTRRVIYDHGPEGRGQDIHIIRTECVCCHNLIEMELEVGKDFERLSRQRLDVVLRNAKTLRGTFV